MIALAKSDLPEPAPFSVRNLFRVIGPGAILLAGGIGGGEWLVGPAIGVRSGLRLFWIATVAISLQVVFNLEAIRYTVCTGEPISTGFMRLKPSSCFWETLYAVLTAAQLGLPSVVGGCAAVLFAALAGRMPETSDTSMVIRISYLVILGPLAILLFGRTIERMLEPFSWGMIAVIFSFLLAVNILFVPLPHWRATLAGFIGLGRTSDGVNLALLAALAATAGSGGMANLAVSNWARDKSFGIGAETGAISGAVGHRRIALTAVGKIFEPTARNLARFRVWRRYSVAGQMWLWGCGAWGDVLERQSGNRNHPAGDGSLASRCGRVSGEVPGRERLVRLLGADVAEWPLDPVLNPPRKYGCSDPHDHGHYVDWQS